MYSFFLLLFSSFLHIMLADLFAVKAIYSVIVLLVLFFYWLLLTVNHWRLETNHCTSLKW